MRKYRFWLLFILAGLVLLSATADDTSANYRDYYQDGIQSANSQLLQTTLLPTASPTVVQNNIPVSRVLPPVGSNLELVFGAIVLVLIIIGGVLGARKRPKH